MSARERGIPGIDSATSMWKTIVTARVEHESPMPASIADRTQLIRRVTQALLGRSATQSEISEFVGDNSPRALASLAKRLELEENLEPFAGAVPVGRMTFRVTAPLPAKENGTN